MKIKTWKWIKIIAVDLFHLTASVYVMMFVSFGIIYFAEFNGINMKSDDPTWRMLALISFPALIYTLARTVLGMKFLEGIGGKENAQSSEQ